MSKSMGMMSHIAAQPQLVRPMSMSILPWSSSTHAPQRSVPSTPVAQRENGADNAARSGIHPPTNPPGCTYSRALLAAPHAKARQRTHFQLLCVLFGPANESHGEHVCAFSSRGHSQVLFYGLEAARSSLLSMRSYRLPCRLLRF